jgi:hypothetical protein
MHGYVCTTVTGYYNDKCWAVNYDYLSRGQCDPFVYVINCYCFRCYNNTFFTGLYSIFELPKANCFFFFWAYRLCAAAPFNILFFFFTLLLVSEQFILYFFYWCTFFSSRCSFPLTLYLHALFVGGSNSSVDFTGRDMIWMQLGHPTLIYKWLKGKFLTMQKNTFCLGQHLYITSIKFIS